jgi:hypothetical protein
LLPAEFSTSFITGSFRILVTQCDGRVSAFRSTFSPTVAMLLMRRRGFALKGLGIPAVAPMTK